MLSSAAMLRRPSGVAARCCSTTTRSSATMMRTPPRSSSAAAVAAPRPSTLPRSSPSIRPRLASTAVSASSPASEAPTTVNVACDLSAFPECNFFKVEAVVRPWRLPAVVEALSRAGITGMTALDVLGAGVQGGKKERYGGTVHGTDSLVEKKMLSIVVFRGQVNAVVRIIVEASRTGEIGDGKIFVSPVADVVRVRTAETGANAEKMEGGMSDLMRGMQP